MFSELLVVVVLEFSDNGGMFRSVLKTVRILHQLVNVPLSQLLKRRLESVGDGLVGGLEVTLALIRSLDARVGEVLCPASTSASSSTTRGCGFGDTSVGVGIGGASTAAPATTATTASASAAAACRCRRGLASRRLILSSHDCGEG